MRVLVLLLVLALELPAATPTPTPVPAKAPTINLNAKFVCFKPGGQVTCAAGKLSNAKLDRLIKDSRLLCAKDSTYICAAISYLPADESKVNAALVQLGATTDGASK